MQFTCTRSTTDGGLLAPHTTLVLPPPQSLSQVILYEVMVPYSVLVEVPRLPANGRMNWPDAVLDPRVPVERDNPVFDWVNLKLSFRAAREWRGRVREHTDGVEALI